MGLKRKGKGPFRGPTSKGVFQTVDLGSGLGHWMEKQAQKYPRRKYVAVDQAYPPSNYHYWYPTEVTAKRVEALHNAGVTIRGERVASFVDFMKKNDLRTRHINIDMPRTHPFDTFIRRFGFETILQEAPHILLPNGKIYITHEHEPVLEKIKERAEIHGLKARFLKPLSEKIPIGKIRSSVMKTSRDYGLQIYRLEITYGLKKAIPSKEQRKKWPKN